MAGPTLEFCFYRGCYYIDDSAAAAESGLKLSEESSRAAFNDVSLFYVVTVGSLLSSCTAELSCWEALLVAV